MKKSGLSQHQPSSAELVIAHAARQRSRGRRPAMPYLGVRNPETALCLARQVASRVRLAKSILDVVSVALVGRSYAEMGDDMLQIAARHILSTSSSRDEVQQRLREQYGYPHRITLSTAMPADESDRIKRELHRGSGGVLMANGAIPTLALVGHTGRIFV